MSKFIELLSLLLLAFFWQQVCCDDDVTKYSPRSIYLHSNNSESLQRELKSSFQGLQIINGNEGVVGQFPFLVALGVFLSNGTFFCGATLISQTTILTAAHCVQGAEEIKVFLGTFNLMDFEEPGSYVTFVVPPNIKSHKSYNQPKYYNDIAIITMDQPVDITDTIKPTKIPSQPTVVTNSSVFTICGWGKITDNSSPITDKMHYDSNIQGQDYDSCLQFYKDRTSYTLSSNHICTSGKGNIGPCRGDSGGPLVQVQNDGSYMVVGLISLGVDSCEIGAPTAYTDVYKYRDWIIANSDYKD